MLLTQTRFTDSLVSTGRDGMEVMLKWLERTGFYVCPASTKFHGCYPGGLVDHSLRVNDLLMDLVFGKAETLLLDAVTSAGQKPLKFTQDNINIATLLHDICKVGAYTGTGKPYKWNKAQPEGHAVLSIKRIKVFIELEPIEEMMIKFHMGIYGTCEYHEPGSWSYGKDAEYHLRSDQTEKEKKAMSAEEKETDKKRRYGKTLRNAWFHNPICKFMYFADETATAQEKAKDAMLIA